jgi:hypothetical protein
MHLDPCSRALTPRGARQILQDGGRAHPTRVAPMALTLTTATPSADRQLGLAIEDETTIPNDRAGGPPVTVTATAEWLLERSVVVSPCLSGLFVLAMTAAGAKGSVEVFTRHLARELGSRGIA